MAVTPSMYSRDSSLKTFQFLNQLSILLNNIIPKSMHLSSIEQKN